MAKPPPKSSRANPAHGKGWEPATPLGALNIPHLDVVLTEVFCLLPPALGGDPWPETIADLTKAADLSFEQVRRKLREAQILSADFSRSREEAMVVAGGYWLHLGYEPPDGAHALDPANFLAQFAAMQNSPAVFVVAEGPAQAFSATMYLRSEGLPHAFAIC
jgi:hypothetical protein